MQRMIRARRDRVIAVLWRCASAGWRLTLLAGLSLAVAGHAPRALAGDDQKVKADQVFRSEAQPLVKRFCAECHSGGAAEAGFDVSKFASAPSIASAAKTWQKAAQRVRAEDMPPPDATQPSPEERRRLIGAIDLLLAEGRTRGRNPGRVTMRRLNRAEYNNTIHDLVGVDFDPADDFPSDDVGYGFDNIGDVLSIPPLLLEKYLAAARRIADAAIVVPGPPPSLASLSEKRLRSKEATDSYGGKLLASLGEVSGRAKIDLDGDYLMSVTAFGEQAGAEPAKMELRVDGKKQNVFDVTASAEAPQEFTQRVTVKAGDRRFSALFINDFYEPDNPDPARRDRNLVVLRIEVRGPLDEDYSKLPESHRRILPHKSTPETQMQDAQESLKRFASRAFRRPARPDEVERLMKLVRMALDEGDSFEQGMRVAVAAVLVSPHFLYRVELDPPDVKPGQAYNINQYELASRLSYFLWSTMPDHELLELAWQEKLRAPSVLQAQLARMLRDPKSSALIENFAGQWLQLRLVRSMTPDAKEFPTFDEPLRAAMVRETELFFASILQENRSVMDFLDADYTFVNERLAKHYGLAGVTGDEFRRVSIPADQRGGVLGQASILSLTSNPTRTSPVKRGRWVLENLLGTPPPAAPADVPPLPEKETGPLVGTLRERMTAHRDKTECAVCHKSMDPLGFGLENFDGVGAWRTHDGQAPIDPAGVLPGGQSFKGPQELRGVLKSRRTLFVRCLTEKLLTYALGRGLEYDDQPAVDDIVAVGLADDRMQTLVRAVIESPPFQRRVAAARKP